MDDFKLYDFDNLLIEQSRAERKPLVSIYSLPNTIVVMGKSSRIDMELNSSLIKADRVPIYRRPGGGCSVVIDPGNVIVSIVVPRSGIAVSKKYFALLTEWIIEGFNKIGIAGIQKAGSSDLAFGDRKISGSCIYSSNRYIYYSAAILVTSAVELLERYLRHPPKEPPYRAGRKHRDFVLDLTEFSKYQSTEDLIEDLHTVLTTTNLEEKLKGQI